MKKRIHIDYYGETLSVLVEEKHEKLINLLCQMYGDKETIEKVLFQEVEYMVDEIKLDLFYIADVLQGRVGMILMDHFEMIRNCDTDLDICLNKIIERCCGYQNMFSSILYSSARPTMKAEPAGNGKWVYNRIQY